MILKYAGYYRRLKGAPGIVYFMFCRQTYLYNITLMFKTHAAVLRSYKKFRIVIREISNALKHLSWYLPGNFIILLGWI